MSQKLKNTTWSDHRVWEGFHGTAYNLDVEKIWELPIEIQSGEAEKEQTTVGKVLQRLKDAELLEVDGFMGNLEIKMTSGDIRCTGLSFHLNVLEVLLTLHKKGVQYFSNAAFFYYDSHSSREEPGDIYEFFIVCDNKIVEESLSFGDYPGSGFDPSAFIADNDKPRRQAWVRFWYRKFYTETQVGQLMALRPDVPELYYYPSRLGTNPFHFRALQVELQRIRWLLIALIIIGVVLVYLASR